MPDIGRLSVSSSTPIWNMSYKQWRRTRRGIHPFDLHQISNLYLYHTKDILVPLKSAVSYKSPSAMCSTTSILLSLPSSICGCQCEWCNIWFSDVYRRPSIKTVYEPMPDDRPRCSSACCENSLQLLRIPILKGQALSFRPAAEDFLWYRDMFHVGRISYWCFAFLVIFFLEATRVERWNGSTVSYTAAVKTELILSFGASLLLCLRSTMSILRRNTGGKIHPSDIDEVIRGSKDQQYCTSRSQ